MDLTDAELIRRFAGGRDEEAFRELYRRHTPAVYGFMMRLTGGEPHDAADILQDAWLKAADGIEEFRGDSAFRTWITGIALNCYRELKRRRSRVRDTVASNDRDVVAETGHDRLAVVEVLNAMSPDHREVLVLHDVEGYTHEEIASALGIEVGTSKSRLSRARQQFRERWHAVPSQAGVE